MSREHVSRGTGGGTARFAALCALGLGAVLAVSGCGTTRPGAAAVLNHDRISVATLQAQVNDTAAAMGSSAQQAEDSGANLSQTVLGLLVTEQVVDHQLAADHVTVTRADAQRQRAAAVSQLGGQSQLNQWLLQHAIAPNHADAYFRLQAGIQALASHDGVDLNSTAGNKAFTKKLGAEAVRMGLRVNPRYGDFHPATFTIGDHATDPWIKPSAKAA